MRTDPNSSHLVSVVVPVFNAARFIDAAVGSVLEQTLPSWELILVDDGSQDDSQAICAAHAARDGRIRVLRQANRGAAAARNAGMRAALGRYITFLDADDRLFPDALETLVEEAERSGAGMVLGNFSKLQSGVLSPQPAVFSPAGTAFTGATATLEGGRLLDYLRHFLTTPSNHLVS
jgi:glycosyltransferase involved in cell wall biosynthesis